MGLEVLVLFLLTKPSTSCHVQTNSNSNFLEIKKDHCVSLWNPILNFAVDVPEATGCSGDSPYDSQPFTCAHQCQPCDTTCKHICSITLWRRHSWAEVHSCPQSSSSSYCKTELQKEWNIISLLCQRMKMYQLRVSLNLGYDYCC